MKLNEAIEEFLLACKADGLKRRSVESHTDRLRRLRTLLGEHDVTEITIKDLRSYAAQLYDNVLSVYTIHGHIRSLHRLFNWLQEEEIIIANPAKRIRLPRLPDLPPKAISVNDLRCMIETAKKQKSEWKRKRDVAILSFLADTGCRLNGLVGIKTEHVELESRRSKVYEKRDKWRYVFIKLCTVEVLKTWLEQRRKMITLESQHALWLSNKGTPLTRFGVQNMLKKLKSDANITGPANAHAFRHRFAISYLLDGGDLATLADLLGHEDVAITKKYYARFQIKELQMMHDRHSIIDDVL